MTVRKFFGCCGLTDRGQCDGGSTDTEFRIAVDVRNSIDGFGAKRESKTMSFCSYEHAWRYFKMVDEEINGARAA